MKRIVFFALLLLLLTGCHPTIVVEDDYFTISYYDGPELLFQDDYKEGSDITIRDANKTGYTFEGWYLDNETGFSLAVMPGKDIIVQSRWSINQYTIFFETYEGPMFPEIIFDYGSQIMVPKPSEKGLVFLGWYLDSDFDFPLNFGFMPDYNFTLYAKWGVDNYTIVFETNGGEPIDDLIAIGYQPITLPIPVKDEYSFLGWYRDAGLTWPFSLEYMPRENVTLYARWRSGGNEIKFHTNGGNTLDNEYFFYDDRLILPRPVKSQYTFEGWYYNIGLTNKVEITDRMPNADITLYAKWSYDNRVDYAVLPFTKFEDIRFWGSGNVSAWFYDYSPMAAVAPFTGEITSISGSLLTLTSKNKVIYADGSQDYMTVTFTGSFSPKNYLKQGDIINQYEPIGNCDKYNDTEYGSLLLAFNGKGNGIPLTDALQIDRNFTSNSNDIFKYKVEYAIFPMSVLTVTQGVNGDYSHQGSLALDLGGKDGGIDLVIAPFTGIIRKVNETGAHFVWIESLDKVYYADGTYDYMTVRIAHANDTSHLKVGQIVKQGEIFYSEGTTGNATGNHIHLEVGKGKFVAPGSYVNPYGHAMIYNAINPFDALFLDRGYTTLIRKDGGYRWVDCPYSNLVR